MKVGAAVAVARRGGVSATYDELNKYFAISGMPIATGQYWNAVYGREKGEAAQDEEGMQTMRTLARNMVFLMKSIALGKEQYGVPQREPFQPRATAPRPTGNTAKKISSFYSTASPPLLSRAFVCAQIT